MHNQLNRRKIYQNLIQNYKKGNYRIKQPGLSYFSQKHPHKNPTWVCYPDSCGDVFIRYQAGKTPLFPDSPLFSVIIFLREPQFSLSFHYRFWL